MRMRFASWMVAVLALVSLATAVQAFEIVSYRGSEVGAGRLLVSLEPDAAPQAVFATLTEHGFFIAQVRTDTGVALAPKTWLARVAVAPERARFVLVTFDPRDSVEDALTQVRAMPGVAEAYPDQIMRPFFAPNDPLYDDYQKYLQQIFLEKAWNRTLGQGVKVAVIDTGYVQSGLTDGAMNLAAGFDFADNDLDPDDRMGHGTQVANTIAHHTDNGYGAAGAAPKVEIIPCKVFKDGERGAYEGDIIAAIDWAVSEGAHVINMSLGGDQYNGLSARACADAVDAGVVVVAASGNDGWDSVSYPGAYNSVIGVGSTNTHDLGDLPTRSDFSNYGDAIDLVAPGNGIIGETVYENQVGFWVASGTSLASPHVAAAAALLVAAVDRNYVVSDIVNALTDTARGTNNQWDYELGWGEIDVFAAMEELVGPSPNQPPNAAVWAEPRSGAAPLEVEFIAGASDPDGDPVSSFWSFSSGESFTSGKFTFVFEKPGIYEVLLSVTDSNNAGGQDSATITVTAADDSPADGKADEGGGCGVASDDGHPTGLALALVSALSWLCLLRRRPAAKTVGIS